ncbi:antitoxin Xre/MbcA/ParS toxin-binding domain-containing protein [uncultured Deefgea sp.]|uniref:antitoxin Xre/MbcA/ParS toxin-binding domain-containing protein n=1 Tax=uncultured Deefgea sp. TaxID=1304914 RepID=UPI00260B275B|nr:antitoxin Xre/MbcA/ParS toxin-binding domain-containing protein [uncultured Deefgea sp.]
MSALEVERPEAAVVLGKALAAAWEKLNVSQAGVAKIIGLSEATVSRIANGTYILKPAKHEWAGAVAFIRIFRSLAGLLDGDEVLMREWLHSNNAEFRKAPIEVLMEGGGVYRIGGYLDSMRGRF